jgi:hypothetical protein
MAKLTDTQLIVLSKAAARDDGAATVPDALNKAAASKLGASLVSRKLMREVSSKPGMPVWQENEEGRRTSLIITCDGRGEISVDEETHKEPTASKSDGGGPKGRSIAQRKHAEKVTQPRPGSKQALVVKMVSSRLLRTRNSLNGMCAFSRRSHTSHHASWTPLPRGSHRPI